MVAMVANLKKNKKFDRKCYNYRKKSHMAKDWWSKKRIYEGNVVTSNPDKWSDDEWDLEASFSIEEEEMALIAIVPGWIDYEND